MGLDEYPATFEEGAETPTALDPSGHGQRESRLLAVWHPSTTDMIISGVTDSHSACSHWLHTRKSDKMSQE